MLGIAARLIGCLGHEMSKKPTTTRIVEAMRRRMTEWPLFDPARSLYALEIGGGDIALGYNNSQTWRSDRTYWDANIIKGRFYLLHIGVEYGQRGKGHGDALYRMLEGMAGELGCTQIRQHPSGKTATGESRRDYLIRRGWRPDGIEVYKDLLG